MGVRDSHYRPENIAGFDIAYLAGVLMDFRDGENVIDFLKSRHFRNPVEAAIVFEELIERGMVTWPTDSSTSWVTATTRTLIASIANGRGLDEDHRELLETLKTPDEQPNAMNGLWLTGYRNFGVQFSMRDFLPGAAVPVGGQPIYVQKASPASPGAESQFFDQLSAVGPSAMEFLFSRSVVRAKGGLMLIATFDDVVVRRQTAETQNLAAFIGVLLHADVERQKQRLADRNQPSTKIYVNLDGEVPDTFLSKVQKVLDDLTKKADAEPAPNLRILMP